MKARNGIIKGCSFWEYLHILPFHHFRKVIVPSQGLVSPAEQVILVTLVIEMHSLFPPYTEEDNEMASFALNFYYVKYYWS